MTRRTVRRAAYATAAVCGLVVSLVAAELWYATSRDRLPADPGFDVDVVAGRDLPGEPLLVALLGDSTVAGVGAGSEEGSLGAHLAQSASRRAGVPVRVIGYGVTGARTSDVVEQLDKVDSPVDAIVIEVGSNDATHWTPLGTVESETRRMLQEARSRADVVVLGSSGKLNTPNFLPPLRQIIMHRAGRVRERQREVAEELGVGFVDVAREVSPAYDAAAPRSTSSDQFHPSALGYQIWAQPLAARLVEQLESR